jgi:hypothetical protein
MTSFGALALAKPFAVLPCCVYPRTFPDRAVVGLATSRSAVQTPGFVYSIRDSPYETHEAAPERHYRPCLGGARRRPSPCADARGHGGVADATGRGYGAGQLPPDCRGPHRVICYIRLSLFSTAQPLYPRFPIIFSTCFSKVTIGYYPRPPQRRCARAEPPRCGAGRRAHPQRDAGLRGQEHRRVPPPVTVAVALSARCKCDLGVCWRGYITRTIPAGVEARPAAHYAGQTWAVPARGAGFYSSGINLPRAWATESALRSDLNSCFSYGRIIQ